MRAEKGTTTYRLRTIVPLGEKRSWSWIAPREVSSRWKQSWRAFGRGRRGEIGQIGRVWEVGGFAWLNSWCWSIKTAEGWVVEMKDPVGWVATVVLSVLLVRQCFSSHRHSVVRITNETLYPPVVSSTYKTAAHTATVNESQWHLRSRVSTHAGYHMTCVTDQCCSTAHRARLGLAAHLLNEQSLTYTHHDHVI